MIVGWVPVQLPKVAVGMEEAAVEGGVVGLVVAAALVDEVVEAAPPDGAAVVLVAGRCEGGLAVEDPHADKSTALEKPRHAMTARRDLRSLKLMVTGTL